jgi:hypothetical protein
MDHGQFHCEHGHIKRLQLYSALQETRCKSEIDSLSSGVDYCSRRGAVSADMRIDGHGSPSNALQPPEKERVVLMERPQ